MKKMNKKGFTLIELLTVIAILAIILLIAAPTILGVLDKAKKNTFKNQTLLYVSGVKTQMALSATGDSEIANKIDWKTDETTGVTTGTIKITDLNDTIMDSKGLSDGNIIITQNGTKYSYALDNVTDGTYCVSVDDANSDTYDISKIANGCKTEDEEEGA